FTVDNVASNASNRGVFRYRSRDSLPVLLTVEEAAALLRTTRRVIYAMIERRQVPRVMHHVERTARRAQIDQSGVHRLRHTFCSHLAMRGAPARAIQELAGHQDLVTTQHYMHLSPAALDSAVRLLDRPQTRENCGEILETGSTETANSFR